MNIPSILFIGENMQTLEERKAANAVASAKYRETHPKTEEQKLAARIYAREFRKRPGQVEKHRLQQIAWRKANPERRKRNARLATRRRRWLKPLVVADEQKRHLYGISLDEYDRRLAERQGICALCKRPFEETFSGRPALDHNHITGQLREFVHTRCNLGISNFLDDPAMCRLEAEYLERHKSGRL